MPTPPRPPLTLTMTTRCTLCGETVEATREQWDTDPTPLPLPLWSLKATPPRSRMTGDWHVVACEACVMKAFPALLQWISEYGPELKRVESAIRAIRRELARQTKSSASW